MPDDGAHPAYTLIRDLPATERPRERLRDYGSNSLSVAELLAILLRTGSAKESALSQAARLLKDFDGLPGLARTSFADLCAQPGLGEAKAAQLMAALELGVRCAETAHTERTPVRSPDDIAALVMRDMSRLDQEEVRVILLDTRNHVISKHDVYRSSDQTPAALREAVPARIHVRVATPRCYLLAKRTADLLGITSPIICHIGAMIRSPLHDSRLLELGVPADAAIEIAAIADEAQYES